MKKLFLLIVLFITCLSFGQTRISAPVETTADSLLTYENGRAKHIKYSDFKTQLQNSGIGSGGGSSTLEYQTEITTNTTLTTQEGLNKVYPVNSSSNVTITVPSGVYSENSVINFERRGSGNVEFVPSGTARIRGVRDIDNKYFINDNNSIVSLLCRGGEEFTIIGNLKRGYSGAVEVSSYTDLTDGYGAQDITVTGSGFSANMLDPVLTGNATLNNWTFINDTQITLNITETGSVNDNITVTYDNGDITVDTDAITIIAETIPYSSLFTYYRFNDDGTDETGSYNSTVTGADYLTGKSGNALNCDNTGNEFAKIADDNAFSFGDSTTDSDFSVSFWLKFTTAGTSKYIIVKRNTGSPSNLEYQMEMTTANEFQAVFWDDSTGGYLGAKTSTTLSASTWYHITLTKTGTTFAGIKIYIDKVSDTLTDISSGSYTAMENLGSGVKIGARWSETVSALGLGGNIDGLAFWSKELSSTEVGYVYDEQNLGNELL